MAFCTQTSLSWLRGSEDEGGGLRRVVALSSQPLCPAQLSQSVPGGSRGAASTSRPQARGRGRGRTGCVFTHVPRERIRAADGAGLGAPRSRRDAGAPGSCRCVTSVKPASTCRRNPHSPKSHGASRAVVQEVQQSAVCPDYRGCGH